MNKETVAVTQHKSSVSEGDRSNLTTAKRIKWREARRDVICLRLEGVEEDVKAARDDGLFPIGFKRRIADVIDGMELLQELLRRADNVPEVEAMEVQA